MILYSCHFPASCIVFFHSCLFIVFPCVCHLVVLFVFYNLFFCWLFFVWKFPATVSFISVLLAHQHIRLRSPVSPSLSVYPPPVFFLVCCSFFFLLVTKNFGHILNAQAKLSNPFSYAIYSTYFIKPFFCLLKLSVSAEYIRDPNNKKTKLLV